MHILWSHFLYQETCLVSIYVYLNLLIFYTFVLLFQSRCLNTGAHQWRKKNHSRLRWICVFTPPIKEESRPIRPNLDLSLVRWLNGCCPHQGESLSSHGPQLTTAHRFTSERRLERQTLTARQLFVADAQTKPASSLKTSQLRCSSQHAGSLSELYHHCLLPLQILDQVADVNLCLRPIKSNKIKQVANYCGSASQGCRNFASAKQLFLQEGWHFSVRRNTPTSTLPVWVHRHLTEAEMHRIPSGGWCPCACSRHRSFERWWKSMCPPPLALARVARRWGLGSLVARTTRAGQRSRSCEKGVSGADLPSPWPIWLSQG